MKNKYLLTFFSCLFFCNILALSTVKAQDTSGCAADFFFQKYNCKVWFNNVSQGDTSGTSYSWSFGDGSTSSEKNPVHEYTKNGNYSVCLHIFDSASQCYSKICKQVEIVSCGTNTNSCKADFSFQKERCKVWFSNLSQGNNLTYSWSFGDGSTSSDKSPVHEYTKNGTYTVCLNISDSANCHTKICKTIQITNCGTDTTDCKADFYFQKDKCKVWFSNSSQTETYTSYYWSFGDGSSSNDKNPSHEYTKNGIYSVCLYVTDSLNQCYSKICKTVEITNCGTDTTDCKADFYFQKDKCKVWFSNASQGPDGLYYSWTFGDGSTSGDKNPVHQYHQNGTYTVCLLIVDSAKQCSTKICKQVEIVSCSSNTDCKADFSAQSYQCTAWFSNTSQGENLKASWYFGDGTTSSAWNPMHTYSQNGTYNVCLVIYGGGPANYCSDTICETIVITGCESGTDCKPRFEYKVDGCEVKFYNVSSSTDSGLHYSWNFGDGHYSKDYSPSHTYASNGVYVVCLNVYGQNCQEQYCDTIQINHCGGTNDCKAAFQFKSEKCTVSFYNASSGAASYIWKFGDGSTSTDANPVHVYAKDGVYEVCLTAYNPNANCEAHYCTKVVVQGCGSNQHDCKADFTFKVKNRHVKFKDLSLGNITKWYWDFGDGYMSAVRNPKHQYDKPGTYKVCLTVIDEKTGCKDMICRNVEVKKRRKNHPQNHNQSSELAPPATKIPEQSEKADIKIYPNPIQSGTLYLENSVEAADELIITDSFGKLIYRIEGTEIPSQIDIDHLETGMYLLTVRSAGAVATKRFFVMKSN